MNVSNLITSRALEVPHKRAQVFSETHWFSSKLSYTQYTFTQLEARINQLAYYFKNEGVEKGDRVLILQSPCLDYCAMVFALFRMGACPVMIDPGMGMSNVAACIKETSPRVMIGIKRAYLMKWIFPGDFSSIELKFSFSRFPGVKKIPQAVLNYEDIYEGADAGEIEEAAILFTSGGTGVPKGVVYTHKIFIEQTHMLQNEFGLTHQDIDVPAFPLFGLFTLAMGMTSVIPPMNPSKPAKADPALMLKVIQDQGATFVAGSPAIWRHVANYCLKQKIKMNSVKYVVMFGAPVSYTLHEKLHKVLSEEGDTFTPYGATECLPITNYNGRNILKYTRELTLKGAGVCVGQPLPQVKVKIIKSVPGPIDDISMVTELPTGEIGEIIVSSPVVTPRYDNLVEETLKSKIQGEGELWHRMGDMGHMDNEGRLWFCGRKAHVVEAEGETMYPICVEAIFNQHPDVRRSALVKVQMGQRVEAGVVIERKDQRVNLGRKKEDAFYADILNTASLYNHMNKIRHVFLHKNFPVDVRHNIKIDRLALSEWATNTRGTAMRDNS